MSYWQEPITYLKGVGPKKAEVLAAEAGIRTFEDLLHFYPRRHLDRSQVHSVAGLREGGSTDSVTLIGKLGHFEMRPQGPRKMLTCALHDGTGVVELAWFQGVKYVQASFQEGDLVALHGRVTFFRGVPQIAHPEMESLVAKGEVDTTNTLKIVPVYQTSEKMKRAGLDARGVRRLVHGLLQAGKEVIGENLPPDILRKYHLLARREALAQIHFPESAEMLARARYRLKFEELFFFQLVLARRRQRTQTERRAAPFPRVGELFHAFYQHHLPFELTGAQKRVVKEVRADLAKSIPMNRLVQGDVGSGKTMVALLCMLIALDNGFQAAFMAPTEILAEQHFRTLQRNLEPLGVEVCLLSGGQRKALRAELLRNIAGGHTRIVVGTHALLEDPVQFQNLGLTIIDEQHKFGVLQRGRLWSKAPSGLTPHNLLMTATPIPRTLAMTTYGEVDVSVIDELPPGRKPIRTVARSETKRLEMFGFLRKQLEEGRQVYVVYPLIDESAKSDLIALENGYQAFTRQFPQYRVGIVHGRQRPEDKEFEMQRFKEGKSHILVSTTVIEVGVDVPNASVMVVENAERFGLSQLHQLRGRVGRGAAQSYCILMTPNKIGKDAKQRLQALVEHTDGFRIAEIDLALRGPGDFLGTKQSGLPEFSLADITTDGVIVETARTAAQELLAVDAGLTQPEHQSLRSAVVAFQKRHNLDVLVA